MTDEYAMPFRLIDKSKTRDIAAEALDENGRLKILPASFWAQTTIEERSMFGVMHAYYGFPTVELVEWLENLINGRRAIEIGAGAGILAEALGIPGTDSYQQTLPKYRAIYALAQQPTVKYGPNVEKIDARTAVRKYKPEVVIGSWVTHKYEPKHPEWGGNEVGVDQKPILRRVDTYVLIGNEYVHRNNPIHDLPHTTLYPDWLYSRAGNGSRDWIEIWD